MPLAGDRLEGGIYDDGAAANVVEGEAGDRPEDLAILLDPSQVIGAFLSSPVW